MKIGPTRWKWEVATRQGNEVRNPKTGSLNIHILYHHLYNLYLVLAVGPSYERGKFGKLLFLVDFQALDDT